MRHTQLLQRPIHANGRQGAGILIGGHASIAILGSTHTNQAWYGNCWVLRTFLLHLVIIIYTKAGASEGRQPLHMSYCTIVLYVRI